MNMRRLNVLKEKFTYCWGAEAGAESRGEIKKSSHALTCTANVCNSTFSRTTDVLYIEIEHLDMRLKWSACQTGFFFGGGGASEEN